MRQLKFALRSIGMIVLTFVITTKTLDYIVARNQASREGIPQATDMVKVANDSIYDQTSLATLKRYVRVAIETNAKKGARSANVRIEQFDTEVVAEVQKLLTSQGYKTELEISYLADDKTKPDFLNINW
jgi:hypothetical protein